MRLLHGATLLITPGSRVFLGDWSEVRCVIEESPYSNHFAVCMTTLNTTHSHPDTADGSSNWKLDSDIL